jgi:hypothetical protein
MRFRPRFCPHQDCASRSAAVPFRYQHHGTFRRLCDGRDVRRFLCLACSRGFSEQTFRVDYRLKRPELLAPLFRDRISKVTHRQSARNHACARRTEERHFFRIALHCEAFHRARLHDLEPGRGIGTHFLLDELETYERARLEEPLTVPVLIERDSGFVVDARVGTLPARSGAKLDPRLPRRVSESRAVVENAFAILDAVTPKSQELTVLTDEKHAYSKILREKFGKRCTHERVPSTLVRDTRNPLWPINHTLARVRDNVSRLVRETWAVAKLRRWLAGHLSIWTCYRNYVRGRTNCEPRFTPAMCANVSPHQFSDAELLRWRVF